MNIFWMIFLTVFLTLSAYAGGDKVNNPRLVLGEDDCVYTMPSSPDNCEEVPAPPQSGIQIYICNEATVVCVPDEDPRGGGKSKD